MRTPFVASLAALVLASALPASARADDRETTALADPGAPAPERDDPAGRVFAELGLGVGTLVVATGLGALAGVPGMNSCTSRGDWLCGAVPFATGAIGLGVGYLLYPLAVVGGGELVGGRGNAGGAYLGALVGGGLAAAMIGGAAALQDAASSSEADIVLAAAIVLGTGAALAGPIVGYELTDHPARAESRRGSVSMLPTMSFDATGARFGVAGAF